MQNFVSTLGNNFLVMAVLTFVALMLLIESLYLLWKSSRGPEAKKVQSRLQQLAAVHFKSQDSSVLKERLLSELSPFERMAMSLPRVRAIDAMIVQSGVRWTIKKLLSLTLAAGLLSLIGIRLLHQPWFITLGVTLLGAALPFMYVAYRRNKRLQKIEQQLPDALDLLARGLRAGHAFSSTLKMAGEEMPEPIGSEFRVTHDEINFGVSQEQALSNLSERVPITDLRYFVVAVLIQRESGGNLTEILGNLSRLIRDRLKLFARIRVLSSEGRLSAWILGIMPFALAGIMHLTNPEFIGKLWTDPIGISIVQYMLVLMAFGVVIMRKIIRIRV
jgi:tight adherence protein B